MTSTIHYLLLINFLYYQATLGPRSLIFLGGDMASELFTQGALLQPFAVLCSLSHFISRIHSSIFFLTEDTHIHSSFFFLTTNILSHQTFQYTSANPEKFQLTHQARRVLFCLYQNQPSLILFFYSLQSFVQCLWTPNSRCFPSHFVLSCFKYTTCFCSFSIYL